ncbi:DUF6199 family natural product biosynthesis protein [Anaeromicropila herbilytica]|uniref:DUF6199 domain-containing protein n=1 Tax=Anaeromicropila herbilytica TaxID=2785025 RepID=A0A7R7EQG2_9FIRM|nr:DUF6199 family natural product biosynthesis protein [Anaeromicropila herbilytica]BCN32870.1 hypothetical protein bsdtb5_41650 [Anaeromicropila herbilytica]
MGILMILVGLFYIFLPKVAWYIEIGWKIKDSEPSDASLNFNRVLGVILCIVGIFYRILH